MKSKFLFFGLLFFLSIHLFADNIKITYTFEKPKFVKEGQYTTIQYENCRNYGPEGAPSMPHFAAEVLIPAGHEITSIKVEHISYLKTFEDIVISPAGRQFPLSQKLKEPYIVKPNHDIYSQKSKYPENMIENKITQYMSGHAIGGFTICPLIFHPSDKKVELIQSITIIIETTESKKGIQSIDNLRNSPSILKRVEKAVDNPEYMDRYNYPDNTKTNDEVDILIITSQELMAGFDDYVNFKTSTGYIVELKDVNEIYTEYEGQDDPEKIRNCIIDYYQNKNLTYVVLGGDADGNEGGNNIVPTRGMYGNAYSVYDDFIPADMYYSCLDGTWDNNGDGVFGEVGEEDMFAEVFVGRMCVDNLEELSNLINKVILYQDQPVVEDIEKSLMLGELLWYHPTWGGDYKDEIADGADTYGYSTVGISDNFTTTRMYERDGDWSHQDIFDQFNNQGINLLNHLGHCDVTYHLTMTTDEITVENFQNNGIDRGFVIDYSQGCYCGAFDNEYWNLDCFAEEFTSFENGAVACVHNSRYGWGMPESTDGASQYFDRQFFDAIFGEDITIIGEANADSKSDNIAFINSHEGAIRWCAYELTLFGDPSMDIWTAQPTAFAVSYPESVNMESSFIEVNTGLEGSRVALLQNSQMIGRTVTDESGVALVETFEPINNTDPITITITGHNKIKYEGTIVVLNDTPYIGVKEYSFSDSPDYGSTIGMEVKFKNFAQSNSGFDAQNIIAKLRTSDSFITVNDSVSNIGTINAGDSLTISDAFSFTIDDSIPDQHTVDFSIVITGDDRDSYMWTSLVELNLNAPELSIVNLYIDDNSGNGFLDPGETANIKVVITNTGHAAISNVNSSIRMLNNGEHMTFSNTEFSIGELSAGEAVEAIFEATVSDSVLLGTPVDVLLSVVGIENSMYWAEEEKRLFLGFVPEYCESSAIYSFGSDLVEFSLGQLHNNTEGDCGKYDDFTLDEDLIYEYMLGSTYDISVSLGTCGENMIKSARVFVDWNYDGDFEDEGEIVFGTEAQDINFTDAGTITIPSDVEPGPKYLRVIVGNAPEASDIVPCLLFGTGGVEDYKIIIVEPQAPLTEFEASVTETTEGEVVELLDLSQYAPTEWDWNVSPGAEGVDFVFVNETTSSSQNPQVKFQSSGQYTIVLEATNAEGTNINTKTDFITINEITSVPVAGFIVDYTVLNVGDKVHITDLSTNTPTGWEWVIASEPEGLDYSFVDGTDMYAENPIVMFNDPGSYSIQLVASNILGDSDPLIKDDVIVVLPHYLMSDREITTCGGMFYDEGGSDGFYFNNSNIQMTFFPGEEGKMIQFDFSEFRVEMGGSGDCYDEFKVYNGESTSSDLLGNYCGYDPLGTLTALNPTGALTFVFESDNWFNSQGWTAEISCVDPTPTYNVTFVVTAFDQPIDGALVDCDGNYAVTNENGQASYIMEAGTYNYTISNTQYDNISDSIEVIDQDLTINISMVGLNSILENKLKIYPNPTEGTLNVELNEEIGKHQILIVDMQGKTVISQFSDQLKNVIDIQSLSDGIYQIIIQNEQYHYVQKIVKL